MWNSDLISSHRNRWPHCSYSLLNNTTNEKKMQTYPCTLTNLPRKMGFEFLGNTISPVMKISLLL